MAATPPVSAASIASQGDIGSVADLLTLLSAIAVDSDHPFWYRGHDDAAWTLTPSLARNPAHLDAELDLMARFQQDASLLLQRPVTSDWDWLALMQHYGCPTRLLDWTESPLVALFFAVCNPLRFDRDGALWLLNPLKLNEASNLYPKYSKYIPYYGDPILAPFLPGNVRGATTLSYPPVAITAIRNSPRMQAQLGTFTLLHKQPIAVERVADGSHVRNYRVPRESKPNIVRELQLLAINKHNVFPELANIGERLKTTLP
ncbi:FRG domain protein [Urbifossiella limnaea]|uniref:FRG domain protein n=2 Tax=Urbifossiella limnaea TaxID=2528023 RepID=A0A517XPR2_9BACT|nr:FRG domain protein [Urbifossiella limnaea]